MSVTFEDYKNHLYDVEVGEIKKKIFKKHYDKSKMSKKDIEKTQEFSDLLSAYISRSKKLITIRSLDESSNEYAYYKKHEKAIGDILSRGNKVLERDVQRIEAADTAYSINLDPIISKFDKYKESVLKKIRNYFLTNKIGFYELVDNGRYYNDKEKRYLSVDTVDKFVELFESCKFSYSLLIGCTYCKTYFKNHFKDAVEKLRPDTVEGRNNISEFNYKIWHRFEKELNYDKVLIDEINKEFTLETVFDLIKVNPHYIGLYDEIRHRTESLLRLQSDILNSIPENYPDLYPNTRKMDRHFVLHIGPTNSGKTYKAISAMKKSSKGVYLAPLRLLAYEQFDNLNKNGFPCNLLTGEEHMDVPSAKYVSSTIEMINLDETYEVGVIDEAQMLGDTDRGAAWTTAIVALKANEIHVCSAPNAKNLLIRLIEDCGDTCEIDYTERQTELKYDNSFSNFPKDVRDGDALIVFSRKHVHAVASILHKRNIECSIIYGALPYDVRHAEAEKFATGKTKVIVATDAIGMGLNLPIRRIVFLSTSKFDGTEYRDLTCEEVRQIAGRAGRYGIFDVGYFAKSNDEANKLNVNKTYKESPCALDTASIAMPESLIDLNVPLSKILKKWDETECADGYDKESIDTQLMLCNHIEQKVANNKHLLYKLITIPFSENDNSLLYIWEFFANNVIYNKGFKYQSQMPIVSEKSSLYNLERAYKICDLIYNFNRRFYDDPDAEKRIISVKKEISSYIMKKLDNRAFEKHTCKHCGCILPWNHMYGMCTNCYESMYGFRNDFYEDYL